MSLQWVYSATRLCGVVGSQELLSVCNQSQIPTCAALASALPFNVLPVKGKRQGQAVVHESTKKTMYSSSNFTGLPFGIPVGYQSSGTAD